MELTGHKDQGEASFAATGPTRVTKKSHLGSGSRIREVRVYKCDLPVVGGSYRMAKTTVQALDSTIVEIICDSGLVGYGETCPVGPVYQPHHATGARAALAEICPPLIGLDATRIGVARHAMDEALNGHGYAKAAVDIALWDLAGKIFGARVCDLLGGALRDSVPAYYAVGVLPPDETVRVAVDKQNEGYRRLPIKLGGRPIEEDIAAIRSVAEALRPGTRLAADANRGWTTRDATLFSLACEDIAMVIEQPCATLDEIEAVRSRIRHPIYLDESTLDLNAVLGAIARSLCDGFGLKLTRLGGLSAMRTIRDICDARALPHTCDDAWGGDIIAAACVHVAATVRPNLLDGVWLAAPYIDGHYDDVGGVVARDGWIAVPRGPGLGVNPHVGLFGEPRAIWR